MKCPGNPEHGGIKVMKLNGDSTHFAKVICKECGAWIKWLSAIDYNNAMIGHLEGVQESTGAEETDAERMKRCIQQASAIFYETFDCVVVPAPVDAVLQIAFQLFNQEGK